MANMADYVKLAQTYDGTWVVAIRSPEDGGFQTKDIDALISQVAITAHVAEGSNAEEGR